MREIKGNLGGNDEYLIDIYSDLSELANSVSKSERKSGRDDSSESQRDGFSDTDSLEEAVNFLKYGSDSFYNKILSEKKKLNIDKILGNIINKPKYVKSVYGFVPNVADYLNGDPRSMINTEKRDISHKVLNIFLNTCYPHYISSNAVNQCGSVYITVLDLLEKAGYRVNLYIGVATDNNDSYYYMMVRAKTDKEPLNFKKMCFPVASSSMLRRINFKWTEACNSRRDGTRNGYGQYDGKNHIKKFLKEYLKEDFIVWEYVNADGKVRVEDILEQLKQYGINLEI